MTDALLKMCMCVCVCVCAQGGVVMRGAERLPQMQCSMQTVDYLNTNILLNMIDIIVQFE